MKKLIGLLAAVLMIPTIAFAHSDEDAVRALLGKTFDKPEARLEVEPVVVSGRHAIAGWSQAGMGGRALLRKGSDDWLLILCSGDGITSADALRQAGVPVPDAAALSASLANAESKLAPARRALLSSFEGMVMMAADGGHPPTHLAQMQHPGMGGQDAAKMASPKADAAKAKTFTLGDLVISEPWLRATPASARVGGGYMKITNNGTTPDRLIGGFIEFARKFEVHEMAVNNGIMTMRPLDQGLEIKPGQTVELAPGGFHVMAMDLTDRYVPERPIKGTLKFEKAGSIDIEYVVRPIGATSAH